MKKKRLVFLMIFLLLVGAEFIIGIYFHEYNYYYRQEEYDW